MHAELPGKLDKKEIVKRYIKAIDKGLLKVMSKMGISTYQSYCGAQIFDAVGLKAEFVNKYFTGTATRIEGVGLDRDRRGGGAPPSRCVRRLAGVPRHARRRRRICRARARRGPRLERHHGLDLAARGARQLPGEVPRVREDPQRAGHAGHDPRPVPRQDAPRRTSASPCRSRRSSRPRTSCKRFATGAMSFGSISREAHTTLAIAMNRIGGKSNTGEGGEEADRFKPLPNGDSMRSAIKQVASGRFGVTAEYLVNSDMMQIKMAQGAKPGEGGQLPGHKVDKTIAKVRHSTPGVGLISPPPHHDIYSIEDLAQLIFDLKNVNPAGDVSVKLVSEVGVGTVAAGVSKARSDHVTISGFEGGTGASSPHLAQARRLAVGDRPRRNPPDAGGQPAAQPHRRAGRRRHPHRPRRGDRRAARRRRVRLLDRAADRGRLHHDAQVPSQHLPGRRRDPGPGAARALHRPARARHQLLLLRRRRGARADGGDGLPHLQRDDRPDADARPAQGDRALEGQGPRLLQAVHQADRARRASASTGARRRTTRSTTSSTAS